MFRVLLIVPYPELKKQVSDVYEKMFKNNGLEVDIFAMKAEDIQADFNMDAYDVIIGRGHSARILKGINSDCAIIDIPITGYDILRAVEESKKSREVHRIALFLSETRNHDASVLSAVSGIDIQIFYVPELHKISQKMEEIKRDNFDMVIGGYSAKIYAEQAGLPAVMIKTGEEAIIQALNEAQNMMVSVLKERARAKMYQTVTQALKEGILYVNEEEIIEMVNKKGLQSIPSQINTVYGQKLIDVYPYLYPFFERTMSEKISILNELIEIEENKLTFDFIPVLVEKRAVGVVITFQSITRIQQMETQIRKKLNEKGLVARYHFSDIIHQSTIMEETIALAKKYAAVSSNILIVGETGTGKELMAQGLHNMSERNKKPFVAVNCAAIPENLLESEIFGYAEGAFTGSKKGGKIGLVEQAHQGTLFLDEISELPFSFQGKLLRVLQEKQVRRIGDDKVIDVDVRIIAATNRNLKKLVEEGAFRQDLLYRLDILKLYIPPLRERDDDVALIFHHLLKKNNAKFGKDVGECTREAKRLLANYPFEGNIRELSNIAERLCVMAENQVIDENLMMKALYPEDIGEYRRKKEYSKPVLSPENEKEEILEALRRSGGKKAEAAKVLGMDRSTLWRKMKNYKIEV